MQDADAVPSYFELQGSFLTGKFLSKAQSLGALSSAPFWGGTNRSRTPCRGGRVERGAKAPPLPPSPLHLYSQPILNKIAKGAKDIVKEIEKA